MLIKTLRVPAHPFVARSVWKTGPVDRVNGPECPHRELPDDLLKHTPFGTPTTATFCVVVVFVSIATPDDRAVSPP